MDAIDQFIDLFENKEEFVKAFVESTLFFPPDVVQKRNEELTQLYKTKKKFPVRYSFAFKKQWSVKDRDEAKKYTRNNVVSLKKYPKFNVVVDHDGNTKVRKLIKENLGHVVSYGQQSTIKNYTISHVWGMATHPLFFSSLWNIVLIPTHFNYLMDKSSDSHEVVREVKTVIKQQCIRLYKPYESLVNEIPEIEDFKDEFEGFNNAETNTDKYNIQFLTKDGAVAETKSISISDEERETINSLLNQMGKTFFIDCYEAAQNEEDLKKVIPIGEYTYNSYQTKVSVLKRIFREGLEIKALALILDNENSRLDEDTREKARELMELYA